MTIKNVQKVKSLLKTKIFNVTDGIAYFSTMKPKSEMNTFVSFKVNLEDGFYTTKKGKIISINGDNYDPYGFRPIPCDEPHFVADVKDVPMNMLTFVADEKYIPQEGLQYLYLDAERDAIVACDGHLLHKSTVNSNDSLLISPVVWKLMTYFDITKIKKNIHQIIISKDDVTITSDLIDLEYPRWDRAVPQLNPCEPFTPEIKDKIIAAIESFEKQGTISTDIKAYDYVGIVFDGTHIKTRTIDGRSFQIDLGVELFLEKPMGFYPERIKQFLKVCNTGMLHHVPLYYHGATVTGDNGSIDVIMSKPVNEYFKGIDHWVSLDTVSA